MKSLWELLRSKEGSRFLTLSHGNEFDLVAVADRELGLKQLNRGQNPVNESYVLALLLEHRFLQIWKCPFRRKYLSFRGPELPEGELDPTKESEFETIETEGWEKKRRFWSGDSNRGR